MSLWLSWDQKWPLTVVIDLLRMLMPLSIYQLLERATKILKYTYWLLSNFHWNEFCVVAYREFLTRKSKQASFLQKMPLPTISWWSSMAKTFFKKTFHWIHGDLSSAAVIFFYQLWGCLSDSVIRKSCGKAIKGCRCYVVSLSAY